MWAGVYSLAGFGFIQALLQPAAAVSGNGAAPLVTAVALFVAFGAASVTFYLYFERRSRRKEADKAPAAADAGSDLVPIAHVRAALRDAETCPPLPTSSEVSPNDGES